jgi:hypothetical protein
MKLESIYEVAIYQHKLWALKMKEARSQQEANEIQCKRLDSFRLSLEAHIYHYLIERYGQQLDEHWQNYLPPKKADHAFVIVERRPHHNFWFVLRNIAWANPYMSVYIFCSDENIDFVNSLLGDKKDNFNVIQAFSGNASRERGKKEVDNLLSNHKTYDSIDAEYIMTVEMDTFYRKKVLPTIFQGTYWGNPWGWKADTPGGGGCTIRNIKAVSRVCKQMNPDENKDLIIAQDAWLSDTCHDLKEPCPDLPFRANHIMENIPVYDPVAIHQFWTFLDSHDITDKFKFINNLKRILTFDI